MKILQLAKFPPSTYGGIEKLVNQISTMLFNKDFKSDILCFEDNKKSSFEVFNTHTVYKARTLFKFQSTSFSIHHLYFLLKLKDSYNLFHLHLPNPLACIYLILFFNSKQKLTIHYHACTNYKKLFWLNNIIEKPILKKAKRIITTSEKLSNSPSLRNFKEKISIIPLHLSDVDFNEPIFSSCNSNVLSLINSKKYIVFIGRIVYYKNLPFLIKAYYKSLFPEYNLLIVGNGPQEDKCRYLISKLKIMENVYILKNIDNNEKRAILTSASFSVLPSNISAEAFGFVQLESMAMGTPIISFEIPHSGVSEVNKNMKTGLVIPHSKDQNESISNLSKAMMKLSNDSNLLKKLSKGAKERSYLYKEDIIIEKYRDFFKFNK